MMIELQRDGEGFMILIPRKQPDRKIISMSSVEKNMEKETVGHQQQHQHLQKGVMDNGSNKVFGYIRVSTGRQDLENQRFELMNFAKSKGLVIDDWIEETISGTKNYDKRKLGELLDRVTDGDLIICSELSRLGRSLFMIMDILNICMTKGARVWTVKDGYRLGDDIQSKVLAFAFGLSAEIERNLISQRTKEALERKKAEGVRLGRKPGSLNKVVKLTEKEPAIRILLEEGCNYSQIARLLHVDRTTLMRYIKTHMPELAPKSRSGNDDINLEMLGL